jgi:hypothetical protein
MEKTVTKVGVNWSNSREEKIRDLKGVDKNGRIAGLVLAFSEA